MIQDTALIGGANSETDLIKIDYLSDYNISELDYIFWNSDSFLAEYSRIASESYSTYSHRAHSEMLEKTDKRTKEFVDFANSGGNLIVFTGSNCEEKYGGEKIYSHTVLDMFNPEKKSGHKRKKSKIKEIENIISKLYNKLHYQTLLNTERGFNLIESPRSGDSISRYYLSQNFGIILALPFIDSGEIPIQEIKNLIQEIRKQHNSEKTTQLPEWTSYYLLPLELKKIEENNIIEQEIQNLKKIHNDNQRIISGEQTRKKLFSTYDKDFESEVIAAFKEIGFDALPGPETHCDILCRKDRTILAVEAKGLKRNTKPGNPAQCRRWIAEVLSCLDQSKEELDPTTQQYAEVLSKLGVDPSTSSDDWAVKGVVIINTFRDNVLEERQDPSEPSFNTKVCEILERDKMCGLTGVQLLNIVLEAQETPRKKDELSNLIINTNGELNSHTDWQTYITKSNTNDGKQD
ncbi:hypothetical protein [Thalassospira tepidiphila]|uniref:hypothetical protein n=1 Tax=Thalassospira tepidiphila TaxID=393657 RepID=UPI003AA90900